MVATALVDRDVRDGARLLAALDAAQVPVVAAYWHLDPETREWLLVFASPQVDENGPFDLYLKINAVLGQLTPAAAFRSDDVQVVETTNPLVAELRIFRGTDDRPYIGSTPIRNEVLGDIYVEGCHLYRAARLIAVDVEMPLELAVRSGTAGKWLLVPGKAVVKHGFLIQVDAPNSPIRTTNGVHGTNAEYLTAKRKDTVRGRQVAQLTRWVWRDGRLRVVEDLPRPVELETPLPAGSTG